MACNLARHSLVPIILLSCALSAADKPEKMPKDFVGGSSDTVKGWTARSYASIKNSPGLYCVYIVDERKNNSHAFQMESKAFLGSPEAAAALSKFTKVKIKADLATEGKGWPEAMIKESASGGTLLLLSGDFVKEFDKHTAVAELAPPNLVAAAALVKAHSEQREKTAKQHELDKQKVALAKEALKEKETPRDLAAIPGLDPKKKDDPKAGKPKEDPKNFKAEDKKTVDATKDPKKKAPEDE